MISSLLMFGSSYNKNKKLSIICYIVMLVNLFVGQAREVNSIFLVINLSTFAILPLLISKIQNKYLNAISSIFAIIMWSVIIDIVCYYMFPQFVGGASIFTYIGRGIIFNSKYILINSIALVFIIGVEHLYKTINLLQANKINNKKLVMSSYN